MDDVWERQRRERAARSVSHGGVRGPRAGSWTRGLVGSWPSWARGRRGAKARLSISTRQAGNEEKKSASPHAGDSAPPARNAGTIPMPAGSWLFLSASLLLRACSRLLTKNGHSCSIRRSVGAHALTDHFRFGPSGGCLSAALGHRRQSGSQWDPNGPPVAPSGPQWPQWSPNNPPRRTTGTEAARSTPEGQRYYVGTRDASMGARHDRCYRRTRCASHCHTRP